MHSLTLPPMTSCFCSEPSLNEHSLVDYQDSYPDVPCGCSKSSARIAGPRIARLSRTDIPVRMPDNAVSETSPIARTFDPVIAGQTAPVFDLAVVPEGSAHGSR